MKTSSEPASSTADRVVCFGELLLRLSPPGAELPLQSPHLDARFGGAEANVAISLAILGHDSAMVSMLPAHAIGRACAGELRRHGVDTGAIGHVAGRMGLYYLIPGTMLRPATVIYDRERSAFAHTPASAYDWPRLLDGARWLHLSGINPALGDTIARISLEAIRVAHANGVRVSFDCNYRGRLWGNRAAQAPALLRDIVAGADLIFGGERDIALMLDEDFTQVPASERFKRASEVAFATWPRLQHIATTGRRHHTADDQELHGMLASREHTLATRPRRLTGIVDRIGSGDAFAAGLLHGMLRGMDDEAALDFALAAACLKHSVPGDANLLREADMLDFLANDSLEVKR